MKESFSFSIDPKFMDYFKNRVKQVFLYITDRCNLLCRQCLYKPNVVFQMGKGEIELKTALSLVSDFRIMGAAKISILGGEPSLYGISEDNIPLMKVINKCKKLGYKYIRMDTNGTFDSSFLTKPQLKFLDELAFSLDGHTAKIHEAMRGEGSFIKTSENIKRAVDFGFNVTITSCIHRGLVEREGNGDYGLESLIRYAESLRVNEINFHVLFKHGFPMDTWTENTDISPATWIKVYEEISSKIKKRLYRIRVRIPKHFVTKEEFDKYPSYYGYCPAKLGERVLIHPDSIIRICSGLISSKYGVARYYGNKIIWEGGPLNELCDHKLNELTPCTNQSKTMKCNGMLPLCFSFKPRQEEFVWHKELNWENRKRLLPFRSFK